MKNKFSTFKEFIEQQNKDIHDLANKHGLILFFKKDNSFFGSPEEGRLIFAKLKSGGKDEEDMSGFRDETKFPAIDLMRSISSVDPVQTMFGLNDLPHIKVVDINNIIKKPKK